MFTQREEGGMHAFDDLAKGLDTGAISRGRAMKLGGAALVASALGLFGSRGAEAQDVELAISRRRCRRREGRHDFCRNRDGGPNCEACCRKSRRNDVACCGPKGCNCCRSGRQCLPSGLCR